MFKVNIKSMNMDKMRLLTINYQYVLPVAVFKFFSTCIFPNKKDNEGKNE